MQIPFSTFPKDTTIVVAVSGGIDSMVLLNAMYDAKFDLKVVHINYQLRGEASDLDEALVRDFCAARKIPLHVEKAVFEGGNLQNWARDFRYNTFLKHGKHVAVAHHADDQAETILMNLFRGGGLKALSGMLAVSQRKDLVIYRPLLKYTKEELYSVASRLNIPFREDISNTKNDYKRNMLRNEVIPLIKSCYDENAVTKLLQSAALAQQQQQLLADLLAPIAASVWRLAESTLVLNLAAFNSLSKALQSEILMQELRNKMPINQERIYQILHLSTLENGKKLILGNVEIVKTKTSLLFKGIKGL